MLLALEAMLFFFVWVIFCNVVTRKKNMNILLQMHDCFIK